MKGLKGNFVQNTVEWSLISYFLENVHNSSSTDNVLFSLLTQQRSWSCQASARLTLAHQQEGGEDFTRSECTTSFFIVSDKKVRIIRELRIVQYRSEISWQSLEAWFSKLDPRLSILENFEDRGSSQVSRSSRAFEKLLMACEKLPRPNLSLKNKGLFMWLFLHSWKHA